MGGTDNVIFNLRRDFLGVISVGGKFPTTYTILNILDRKVAIVQLLRKSKWPAKCNTIVGG